MMREAFTIATVAFLCIAAATSPPVTFESPCECRDNHGEHRWAVITKQCPARCLLIPPDVNKRILRALYALGWGVHNSYVDRPVRRVLFYIRNAKAAACNLVQLFDSVDGTQDFGTGQRFNMINAAL
jgi:hypothetical protein